MKRVTVDEMIDTGEGSAPEIAASLTDMQSLNRWFGGEATSLELLRRVLVRTGQTRLRVLENGRRLRRGSNKKRERSARLRLSNWK